MDDTVVRSQKMECSDGTLSWITSSSLSLSLQVVSFKLPIEISHNIIIPILSGEHLDSFDARPPK